MDVLSCTFLRPLASKQQIGYLGCSFRKQRVEAWQCVRQRAGHLSSKCSIRRRSDVWACDANQESSIRLTSRPLSRRLVLLATAAGAASSGGFSQPADATSISAEEAIRAEVRKVVTKAKAPGALRLVFHDAGTYNPANGTGGSNGSVIYELKRPENNGLNRSVRILEKAKAALEPSIQVSWADLIAVAGAEAVELCGGPHIPVRLGRIDAKGPDPEDQLPPETLDVVALKSSFSQKGYSVKELVVLSGAHTLGGKGFGDSVTFDNSYYTVLLQKPWTSNTAMSKMIGLPTDRALADDDEALKWVRQYASDQDAFFAEFVVAYDKLVTRGVRWSTA